MLWADPLKSRLAANTTEIDNEERNISIKFGWLLLKQVLQKNGLKAVVRAHQEKDQGFKLHMWAGQAEEPVCITIFSAPNYKGHENPGSIFLTGSDTEKDRVLCFEETES